MQARVQPRQIPMAAGFDSEDQKLRSLVAMELVEASVQIGKSIGFSLEQKHGFSRRLDLPLPAVNRVCPRKNRRARDQLLLNQLLSHASALFRADDSSYNDANI